MFEYKPIHWYSGLYLQPQHFQIQQLHDEYWRAHYHLLTQPWAWGVISAVFNQAALRDGELQLHQGRFIFPDGVYVDCLVNAVATPRSLRHWTDRGKPLRVYIGLAQVSSSHNNVTYVATREEGTKQATRWIAWPEQQRTADLFGKGPEAEIQQITYNLQFFLQDEVEHLTGFTLLPVGQLCQGAEGIHWDNSYIPPCMTLHAVPQMWRRMDHLYQELTGRLHQLEEMKRSQSLDINGLNQGRGIFLLTMCSLARHISSLSHYCEARDVHPWHIVKVLRELAAELSCFSDRFSFNYAGQEESGILLVYQHQDIVTMLDHYEQTIITLINGLLLTPDTVVPLLKQDESGYFQAKFAFPGEEFAGVYLVLRSACFSDPQYPVPDDRLIKIASETRINMIISRSLAGVKISYQDNPPHGLPQRKHTRYFRVEEHSPAWELIKESGGLVLYWPHAPEDLQADLILIREG